jgi:hypothetical protein
VLGETATVRFTSEWNPFSEFTIMLEVAVEPDVKLTGLVAVIAKSEVADSAWVSTVIELREIAQPMTSTSRSALIVKGKELTVSLNSSDTL